MGECKYHYFVQVLDNEEVSKEVCERCGWREIYKKVGGRIDNRKYLRDHVRDFCQPEGVTGKVFEEIYGRGGVKRAERERERRKNKVRLKREAEEMRERLRKR